MWPRPEARGRGRPRAEHGPTTRPQHEATGAHDDLDVRTARRVASGPGVRHRRPPSAADLADHRGRPGHRLPVRADAEGLRHAQTDVFLTDVDSIAGTQALSDHFPGGSGNPVVIIAPEAAADQVVSTVAGVEGISGQPTLVTDDRAAARRRPDAPPKVVNGLVQVQATLTATVGLARTPRTPSGRCVTPCTPSPSTAARSWSAGTPPSRSTPSTPRRATCKVIIPAVLLAVLLVLILLLRSLVAALLLTVATVLSFGAALGVSALMFNHVFDFPGADPAVPLFAFVFLVALGIDYSIFLMTRAREEVAFYGPHDGVMRGLRVTGGVITSAGLVLAATFAALAVIPILFLAQIAFIVAFGVLLDTFIVRTLLVPALAIDMGWFTWWPIRPKPTKSQLAHRGPSKVTSPGREADHHLMAVLLVLVAFGVSYTRAIQVDVLLGVILAVHTLLQPGVRVFPW